MAAGRGSRMKPFTDTIPKPLIKIAGKTPIEHSIGNIVSEFESITFIVRYKKEDFKEYFSNSYKWINVHYVEQCEKKWTWAAILSLKWNIQGEFIVLSGDDIYDENDIKNIINQDGYATLCKKVEKPENFGIFKVDNAWKALGIVEKPSDDRFGNLANIGIHKFDDQIFDILESIPLSSRWELEITDLIEYYMKKWEYSVVEAQWRWITVGYPWDLLKANDEIIWNYTTTKDKWAIIEDNVQIKWNILLWKWSIIKHWTYIEWNAWIWENVILWPNAYIRGNTSIGDHSKVGAFVELKWSYVGENSAIPHLSYIGDSIIGNHVNIGCWTKTANLRHDNKNIRVMIKWELIDSWRRKLGGIIGDDSKLGIDTKIYPGRIIETNGTTVPGEIVK